MTATELDGWISAIQQLTRIQSGASGPDAPGDSKRIVSKRRRRPRP